MIPLLIFLRPIDLATGNRVDIRIGSAADATPLGFGGDPWEPLVVRRPRIAQDVMSLDLDGKFKLAVADLVIGLAGMKQHPVPQRLYWPGAPIVIYRAVDGVAAGITIEFAGLVTGAPVDLDTKRVTLNCTVDRTRIDKPFLVNEFAGTGGAEGDPNVRGTLKPAGFGYVESREWVLFDTVNNIGMLDGYGNMISVVKAYEALNDLGASVGDFASYAALKAAILNKTIPPGRWGTCIAQGMVGLGAPPTGRITFTAQFGINRSGALIKRILALHAGLAATEYDGSSLDALDASVNREIRLHVREQVQISDLIEAIALPLNATPIITVQNRIGMSRATPSTPIAILNRTASIQPRVTGWRIAEPIEPTYKITYRVARPGDVLTYEEVNYVDTIVDRGGYVDTETYRAGNLVALPNKSTWLYINSVPTSGNYPAPGPYWQAQQGAIDSTSITYSNGQSLDSLRPAEAGATLGAVWNSNLTMRPANLAGLAGAEPIQNTGISIAASGALSGAGGGQVTYGGIGGGPVGLLNSVDVGGVYASGFLPTTRAVAGLINTGVTIGANGVLSGGGGGQVTFSGVGGGPVGVLSTVDLGGVYASGTLPTSRATGGLINSNVSIANNGVLAGGGGGQVTINGLGYVGSLSATEGATWNQNLYARPGNLANLNGNEGINNAGISIGSNGALVGGGGGQVTLGGLGAGALAFRSTINSADIVVANLGAINAEIGFLVSYTADGGRTERDGNGTRVYSSTRLRVKMGR
jgi:hypothetical protein